MNKWRTAVIIVELFGLISGCSSNVHSVDTASLNQLQQLNATSRSGNRQIGAIRMMAIKDTAMSIGARGGLYWRARQINRILVRNTPRLDLTYNFSEMLLNHNVIPPVLDEAQNILALDNPDTIRLAAKTYRIVSQAHFVTAPPTWRDYLWMSYSRPGVPNNSLLPRNTQEQKIWATYIRMGWSQGVQQANNIFQADLSRLNRDYRGMALYRKLYAQNIVSAPFVAKTDLGVTGNGNSMSIDDQVLRITALPQLNLKSNSWKPVIVPGNNEAAQYNEQEPSNVLPANQDPSGTWRK